VAGDPVNGTDPTGTQLEETSPEHGRLVRESLADSKAPWPFGSIDTSQPSIGEMARYPVDTVLKMGGELLGGLNDGAFNGNLGGALGSFARSGTAASQELSTVGRWMSRAEYNKMVKSGAVQESFSGTTHVALPASSTAFKGAAKGSLYVEFKVPNSALKSTNEGWAKVIGPNSLEGRLAAKKGQPIPEMPKAEDIVIRDRK